MIKSKVSKLRDKENPDGLLFANVNPTTKPKVAQKIVQVLNANALQIHLNSVQEAVMPEGDRGFSLA